MPYTVLAAVVIRVFGTSEIALRLPSVLAAGLAAWLLFRVGEHFLDREGGALVVVVFVSLHPIATQAATNARPYAIALLLVVASVLQLVRWVDKRRLRNLIGFVFATAAILYFQGLFVTVYLALLAYPIYTWRLDRNVRVRDLLIAVALIGILLTPLIANSIYGHRVSSDWSFSTTPDANRLVSSFMPPVFAGSLFIGVLVGCLACHRTGFTAAKIPRSANFLFVTLFALPVITLFMVARVSPLKVFVTRYYLPSFVALALIVGSYIRVFAVPRMRMSIAIFIALASIATYSGLHWAQSPFKEDWRAAAETVRAANISPTTPVLIRVGLIETTKLRWGLSIDPDSPLLCPLSKYPVPGRIVLLPYRRTPESIDYLQEVTVRLLKPSGKFILVVRDYDQNFVDWMRGWFLAQGFEASQLGESPGVSVFSFSRHER
jgi:mannosyltransferase